MRTSPYTTILVLFEVLRAFYAGMELHKTPKRQTEFCVAVVKTLVLIRSLCPEIYDTHRTATSFFIRQQTIVPLFITDTGVFKCLEFPDCKMLSKYGTKHVIAIFQHLCLRCESSILSSSSKYPTYAPLNAATMRHLADLQIPQIPNHH